MAFCASQGLDPRGISHVPPLRSANRWQRARSSPCRRSLWWKAWDRSIQRGLLHRLPLILVGSVSGAVFVADSACGCRTPKLPFPNHGRQSSSKAGQARQTAKYLFYNSLFGAGIFSRARSGFMRRTGLFFQIGQLVRSVLASALLGFDATVATLAALRWRRPRQPLLYRLGLISDLNCGRSISRAACGVSFWPF